ncbi:MULTISPECIES: hypothetical protein [unclassified Butyrivibrio]|uniref:hypothetical protein n=1 Tax=unclassified Butyrivibrio TaxID=2639466 RepID=UPI0003B3BFBB|nr:MULTISPECIES: hypothetical protein [unclassified Butyrivibrio]
MRRKEIFIVAMLMFALVFEGCGAKTESDVTIIGGADGPTSVFLASKNDKNSYTQIDQETAKLMMELDDDHVVVDEQYKRGKMDKDTYLSEMKDVTSKLEELRGILTEIEKRKTTGEYNLNASIEVEKKLKAVVDLDSFDSDTLKLILDREFPSACRNVPDKR